MFENSSEKNFWWRKWIRNHDYNGPIYIYNKNEIRERCISLRTALGNQWSVLYALKANSHPEILSFMKKEELVSGVDVASIGEFRLALEAGFLPHQISVTGPVKTDSFLQELLHRQVGCICVESLAELHRIVQLGGMKSGKILVRINPKEEARAFQLKISGRPMPFGVDEESIDEVIEYVFAHKQLLPFAGIHVHAGSQCFGARGFAHHLHIVLLLAKRVQSMGLDIEIVNIGGGLGSSNWVPHQEANVDSVAKQIHLVTSNLGFTGELRMEPGRFLVASSGVYCSRVEGCKRSRGTCFILVDGGMHHIHTLTHSGFQDQRKQVWVENCTFRDAETEKFQIVGSLCTPYDRLGGVVEMVLPHIGDILCFPHNGAYGLSMSPTLFLAHPLPKEYFFDLGSL